MAYEIRTMSRQDVDFAVELAAREGWNPSLFDAECFYQTDPNGFFMGVLDGEPIGCISAVAYQDQFGFIGFYIVRPEYRHQGYGIQLWNTAMTYLAGRNIGLDGVVEQQANYQKSGFKLAYRNIRYAGIVGPPVPDAPVVPLDAIAFDYLATYDRRVFPARREAFLRCWTTLPTSKALAYLDHDTLAGYGVIRQCRQGYKIGPLFADNAEIAEALFTSLTHYADEGSQVYLDVPEVNPAALVLVERHGMNKVFETARMYTQTQPDLALDRLFGVTTFELG
jgi:ribosomal protein S18 acetylase RimI-like enzyme